MFVVDEPAHAYADPWNIPYEQRFRDLCAGRPRIAYFYEHPDTSTFRYRIYNMIQVLRAFGDGVNAAFFCNADQANLDRVVDNADILVICRARYNQHINRMVTRARGQGKRVLFDVDDLVFDTSYTHLILKTLDQNIGHSEVWDHWFGWIGRIGATLRMCDGAITTNAFLAARLAEFSGLPVSIVPNFLNREQLYISDRIYGKKQASGFARTSELHVGYFSGTPTHNHDFAMIAEDLAEVMAEHPSVRLRVVGFMEPKGSLAKLAERIEFYPLHDFINLQRLMSLVEINIVPLQDNVFTNCKSELKYFEAAAVGTLTIASPVHTYANAIQNGHNGRLARSTEWAAQLNAAIAAMDDYPAAAARAHQAAMDRYAWYHQYPAINAALFGSPPVPEDRTEEIALETSTSPTHGSTL
jgi:glycosyltransferase involved in cell wall biosynthesis